MVITYGTRTLFKREGAWGHAICKNCGHDAPQTLCRQLDHVVYDSRFRSAYFTSGLWSG